MIIYNMISITVMPKKSFSFTAIFQDISGYPKVLDAYVDSGKFEVNGVTFYLRLFPGGTRYSYNTYSMAKTTSTIKSCGLYIYASQAIRASYSFKLLSTNVTCYTNQTRSSEVIDLSATYGHGWPDFVSCQTLNTFTWNDTITIICDVTVYGTVQSSTNTTKESLIKTLVLKQNNLSHDMEQCLFNESSADIYIICDNIMHIPAHKFILQLRSVVFQTMFSSGLMESNSDEIIIADFEYEVVKEFIQYLYLDTCKSSVLVKHANSLLAIAHKYEVKGLIQLCERYLIDNLTVDNAVDMMKLGDMYGCTELQKCSTGFIKTNCEQFIQKSKFYQCLTSEPSHEAVETISEMLK